MVTRGGSSEPPRTPPPLATGLLLTHYWATAFLKISLILCGTTEIHRAKRVPLKNGRARNSGHCCSSSCRQTTTQTLPPNPLNLYNVQYYCVVLCESGPPNWQKLVLINASFSIRRILSFGIIYLQKRRYIGMD